jgi:CheY-like chemotaxis protein
MHILLIDDSSSTRSLLRTLINSGQDVRHEFSEAASGEEALQKVGSGEINLPDLIILDINMGGMTGYELCREFRNRHSSSDINPYIIVVTANSGVDVINQALDSGANDYMPKPVNVKVLQVRLRVAERLLMMAQSNPGYGLAGGQSGGAQEPVAPPEVEPAAPVAVEGNGSFAGDPRILLIGEAIDHTDAPITLVDVAGEVPTFQVTYANAAMISTTQFEPDQLNGQSLAELEAWTPEFSEMVTGYIQRGAILSHAPLWSQIRQAAPVYLSFYPVQSADGTPKSYLVIHHF